MRVVRVGWTFNGVESGERGGGDLKEEPPKEVVEVPVPKTEDPVWLGGMSSVRRDRKGVGNK